MVFLCIASIVLSSIALHGIALHRIAWHCIAFDYLLRNCMVFIMVLHGILLFCMILHGVVQLIWRAGELPRSASSHFKMHQSNQKQEFSEIHKNTSYSIHHCCSQHQQQYSLHPLFPKDPRHGLRQGSGVCIMYNVHCTLLRQGSGICVYTMYNVQCEHC